MTKPLLRVRSAMQGLGLATRLGQGEGPRPTLKVWGWPGLEVQAARRRYPSKVSRSVKVQSGCPGEAE
jgi:hypothetical protein